MLLAIDSGNTNIVFAVFDDEGAIRGEWRSSSHADRTADEFGVWLEQLMKSANLSPADITASIIATVVPATLFSMKSLCRDYFDCDPLVIGEDGIDLGLEVLIDRPEDDCVEIRWFDTTTHMEAEEFNEFLAAYAGHVEACGRSGGLIDGFQFRMDFAKMDKLKN
mgnify:CR=1 FL=1